MSAKKAPKFISDHKLKSSEIQELAKKVCKISVSTNLFIKIKKRDYDLQIILAIFLKVK